MASPWQPGGSRLQTSLPVPVVPEAQRSGLKLWSCERLPWAPQVPAAPCPREMVPVKELVWPVLPGPTTQRRPDWQSRVHWAVRGVEGEPRLASGLERGQGVGMHLL